MPTWLCRDPGPEGEFLRKASIDQHWVTSSGYLNCVSAGGRFLGGMASPEILDAFAKLPENERLPGAVKVPGLPEAARVIPEPPEGGIVLRVHARFLHREGGTLRAAALGDFPQIAAEPDRWAHWALFLQPNTEYAWLTADECRAMIPDNPKAGDRIEGDPTIAARLARFHLTPKRATTSEAGILRPSDVRAARFTLEVTEATPERVRLRLGGEIKTGSEFDAEKATSPNGPLPMGFEAPLAGIVEFDRKAGAFTRFDITASGEVWGRWGDANNNSMVIERPGRQPFGFALELAPGKSPTDRIPPGGNGRYLERGYFAEPK